MNRPITDATEKRYPYDNRGSCTAILPTSRVSVSARSPSKLSSIGRLAQDIL